ncbi:hypothetical protein [Streptomyces sp. DfronAA-171]|uniref:hypothetical protein n=1 Tax=Streptomyces sp. DfronAA-171 TaxID=1839777 RepID=UPI00159F2C8F|nr:hypothetical protein [Streptomyces sp. DfronAA-171]
MPLSAPSKRSWRRATESLTRPQARSIAPAAVPSARPARARAAQAMPAARASSTSAAAHQGCGVARSVRVVLRLPSRAPR